MRRISAVSPGVGVALAAVIACGDGEEGTADYSEVEGETSICGAATFVVPADGATLRDAEDADRDCANGIQLDVQVATNAPTGTPARLFLDGDPTAETTVEDATARFERVQIRAAGEVELRVWVGREHGCEGTATVTARCEGPPSCAIRSPVLDEARPELNGVLLSDGGDRVSHANQPFQTIFEVLTSAEEGQLVTLTVDGRAYAAVAVAVEGVAVFPRVVLEPDGPHRVMARCLGANGKWGTSEEGEFPVDTVAPEITSTLPVDGQSLTAVNDVDSDTAGIQFQLCGIVAAADAIDLPEAMGSAAHNFCARIGSGEERCAPSVHHGVPPSNGACVVLDCPPDTTPFDILVTLHDDAGNESAVMVRGVTCESGG